jgi:hypothetical protein
MEPTPVPHFGMTKDEGTVLHFVGTGPTRTDNPEKSRPLVTLGRGAEIYSNPKTLF